MAMNKEPNISRALACLLSLTFTTKDLKWFESSEEKLMYESHTIPSSLRTLNLFFLTSQSLSKESKIELSRGIWTPILELVSKSPEG